MKKKYPTLKIICKNKKDHHLGLYMLGYHLRIFIRDLFRDFKKYAWEWCEDEYFRYSKRRYRRRLKRR